MPTEKTIWGIHMGLTHEMRPIEKGYIAIGWKAVGAMTVLIPRISHYYR